MRSKGFTLIELIVVIGILGILAAAAIMAINPVAQIQKANDARRKADINEIKTALELYKIDEGVYPAVTTLYNGGCEESFEVLSTQYIRNVPCDPTTDGQYVYIRQSDSAYTLTACLERSNDNDAVTVDASICSGGIGYQVFNP